MSWTCPRCDRSFRQVNQRHACGTGDRERLLRDRPEALVELYENLEATIRGFGEVEVVTRDRYALFRTTRIFVDLTVMRDALRVVIHLGRELAGDGFEKVVRDRKRFSHVVKVRGPEDLARIEPWLREAYELAVGEES